MFRISCVRSLIEFNILDSFSFVRRFLAEAAHQNFCSAKAVRLVAKPRGVSQAGE